MTRLFLVALAGLLLGGCIERTITITSEPSGALVYLNDTEVGRTPVTVPFTFYGKYDVRLEKDGFETLNTVADADGPWWENPGPDLIAEALPGRNEVALRFHYDMLPLAPVSPEGLIDRARQMRAIVRKPAPGEAAAPADAKSQAPEEPATAPAAGDPAARPNTPMPQPK